MGRIKHGIFIFTLISIILTVSLIDMISDNIAEAKKAQGIYLSEISSKNVCGDFICDKAMTTNEKIQKYLQRLANLKAVDQIHGERFLFDCDTSNIERLTPFPLTADDSIENSEVSTVDAKCDVGKYSSIIRSEDGNPMIIYYDNTNKNLKFVKCGNPTCTFGNKFTTIDSEGTFGIGSALILGNDGNPMIGYFDDENYTLKFAKCGNTTCTSGNSITTVDSIAVIYPVREAEKHISMALGDDGNPVMAYFNDQREYLKFVKCGNTTCTSENTISAVDYLGSVGKYVSLIIGNHGNAMMSYYSEGNGNLKFAHCSGEDCGILTITTLDSEGDVGKYSSLALGANNLPMISYYDDTNNDLKFVRCDNQACTGNNRITTVDSQGSVGRYSSIAQEVTRGLDDPSFRSLPIISYYDDTNNDLKLVRCGDRYCQSENTFATIDFEGDVGRHTSITDMHRGVPVISYYDVTNKNLKVATSPWSEPYYADISLTVSHGGFAPKIAGDPMTWAFLVENLGPDRAENVKLLNVLLRQSTFESIEGCNPVINDYSTCEMVFNMRPGDSEVILLNISIDYSANDFLLTHEARVESDTIDSNIQNNIVADSVQVLGYLPP